MSKIRIDLETSVINGQTLTFQSPADCSQIEGLIVYYPEGNATTSKDFAFVDAHGVDVGSGTISLFAENSLVKVVLDVDGGKAYVQNADTNAYLEGRFDEKSNLGQSHTDNTVAHVKDVPADSASYAKVLEIGGMTYKANVGTEEEPVYELRSAPVTEVKRVGVNLFDYESHKKNGNTSVIKVIPNKVLYRNGQLGNTSMWEIYDNADALIGTFSSFNFAASSPMVLPSNAAYIKTRDNIYTLANLYIGYDSDTTYRPYVRNTLPIPEAVQSIDGYGWGVNESVYSYINCKKKQFVKRVGCVDLGTLDWAYVSSNSYFKCVTAPNDMSFRVFDYSQPSSTMLCENYPTYAWKEITLSNDNFIAMQSNYFAVKDLNYTDAATFKAAMSGVMLYYELATPIITDISDLLTSDNLIGVEGGGTITMVNEFGYDVPNTVEFFTGNNELIAADKFVGDLAGTAARAVCDKDGNNIKETYSENGHKHTKSEIEDFPSSMPPTAHNQGADTITAGTFAGQVVANDNGQNPSQMLLRNSKLVPDDQTYPLINGSICWQYE